MADSGSQQIVEKLREGAHLIASICDAAKCTESIRENSKELKKIIERTDDVEKMLNNNNLQADQLLQDLKQPQEDLKSALRNSVEFFPQLEMSVSTLWKDVNEFAALVKRIFEEQKKSGAIPDMSEIRPSLRKLNESAKTFAVNCKELCEQQQKAQAMATEFADKMTKKSEELLAAKTPRSRLALDKLKSLGLILSGTGVLMLGRITKLDKLSDFGAGLTNDGVAEGKRWRDKANRNRELSDLAEAMLREASKMGFIAKSLAENEDKLAALLKSSDSTEAWELALKLLDKNLKTQEEFADLQMVVGDKDAQLADKDAQLADKDAQLAQKDSQMASLIELMRSRGIAIPSKLSP